MIDYKALRTRYPVFIFDSYSADIKDQQLLLTFHYSLPPDLKFVHTVTFENLQLNRWDAKLFDNLVFQIGLSEMPSYWKAAASPVIEITAGSLTPEQIAWWHKLLIKGMGEYFYQNQIDFTPPDFLKLESSGPSSPPPSRMSANDSILIPLGGGKDSIVTLELLKAHFPVQPFIVFPASPATINISRQAGFDLPPTARRHLDPAMINLDKHTYLTGHIPYSATLAFISLLTAAINNHQYIAISNERSSNEGNVFYLGHEINHQYSKSLEFETDFNAYVHKYLNTPVQYFSFLRPLYELQISRLFSKYPKYFTTFRSCNRGQKTNAWCGRCAKCLSIAMTLLPWTNLETIIKIFGHNPLTNPQNQELLVQMTDTSQVKPFECVTTVEEALVALDLIKSGTSPQSEEFLSRWEDNPNLPEKFSQVLKSAYVNS